MRSSVRFIELTLLGVGASFAFGCSDEPADAPSAAGRSQDALSQNLGSETEPNGAYTQANTIGTDVVIRANIVTDGDLDYFRFAAEPGTRAYAATMTAFSSAVDPVRSSDSELALLDMDGTSVMEVDDDHGFIGSTASSIAGARIATRGNYFFRVQELTRGALRPYDLHFRLRQGSPAGESEPNDVVANAQPIQPSGWVSGAMSSATDVDVFSVTLAAGDTVFGSLDLDPERDDSAWNGVLSFGEFAGSYLTVNDETGDLPSEALFATVKSAGTYYFRVATTGAAGTFGNYHLSVSVHPATAASTTCTTYTSTDVPKTIPDPGRTTSTISVPGTPRIDDLDVSLRLTHTFPGDLDVHLRSPAGNDIALFTDVGSGNFPDLDLTIDDEAAFPLTEFNDTSFAYASTTALSGLVVQPEVTRRNNVATSSRLHWFDGENAGGTWTLVVDDDVGIDSGSLTSWSITVCEPPARVCPSGAALVSAVSANFDDGNGGFTTSGASSQWARGIPSGPAGFVGCDGGSGQCWKTNLTGNYADGSTQDLVSPAIDLRNVATPITLSWAMKYQLESATFDHAWVEVRDTAAARTQRVWEFLDGTMRETVGATNETLQETAGWGIRSVDLSAFAGRTIQVAFHLDADGQTNLGGLAIDDFLVQHCGAAGGGGAGGRASGGTAGSAGAATGGNAGESVGGGGPEGGTSGEGGEATGGAGRGGSSTGGAGPRGGSSGNGASSGTSGDLGGEGGEGTGGTKTRHAEDIVTDPSCGCRVPRRSSRSGLLALFTLGLGGVALRRRARR